MPAEPRYGDDATGAHLRSGFRHVVAFWRGMARLAAYLGDHEDAHRCECKACEIEREDLKEAPDAPQ